MILEYCKIDFSMKIKIYVLLIYLDSYQFLILCLAIVITNRGYI